MLLDAIVGTLKAVARGSQEELTGYQFKTCASTRLAYRLASSSYRLAHLKWATGYFSGCWGKLFWATLLIVRGPRGSVDALHSATIHTPQRS